VKDEQIHLLLLHLVNEMFTHFCFAAADGFQAAILNQRIQHILEEA